MCSQRAHRINMRNTSVPATELANFDQKSNSVSTPIQSLGYLLIDFPRIFRGFSKDSYVLDVVHSSIASIWFEY